MTPRLTHRWLLLACLATASLTSGCADMPSLPTLTGRVLGATPAASPATCEDKVSTTEGTRLSAIEQLLDDDKPYAALAQLDRDAAPGVRARYLRAESLRRVSQFDAAQAAYQALMGTCLKGQAHHGLGLMAARQGQLQTALIHLRQARVALPTDPRVRNDLGYALLLANELRDARTEFLTALDLQPGDARAARNLVVLAFRQGEDAQAEKLARRFGLDAGLIAALRRQAQALPSFTS